MEDAKFIEIKDKRKKKGDLWISREGWRRNETMKEREKKKGKNCNEIQNKRRSKKNDKKNEKGWKIPFKERWKDEKWSENTVRLSTKGQKKPSSNVQPLNERPSIFVFDFFFVFSLFFFVFIKIQSKKKKKRKEKNCIIENQTQLKEIKKWKNLNFLKSL